MQFRKIRKSLENPRLEEDLSYKGTLKILSCSIKRSTFMKTTQVNSNSLLKKMPKRCLKSYKQKMTELKRVKRRNEVKFLASLKKMTKV